MQTVTLPPKSKLNFYIMCYMYNKIFKISFNITVCFNKVLFKCIHHIHIRRTNLWTLRSKTEGFVEPLCPNSTLTRRTNLSSSTLTSTTFARGQWFRGKSMSLTRTISPKHILWTGLCHFCRIDICAIYSLFHLDQNCSRRYCTRLHRLRKNKSSLTNSLGGELGISDFAVRMWFGVRGSKARGSSIFDCKWSTINN